MLTGRVPGDTEYFAGRAGDSPFEEGERLVPGTPLVRPTLAWFYPEVPPEPPIPFDYQVIHDSGEFVVVDKPHFLPATTNGRIVCETVQTRLRVRTGRRLSPLHRLDRLTAGLLACGTPEAARWFQQQKITKTYQAKVAGEIPVGSEWETISVPMAKRGRQVRVGLGKPTETRLRRVGSDVVELQPVTGRTHQLRALLSWLGCPIVGGRYVPVGSRPGRVQLQRTVGACRHPVGGSRCGVPVCLFRIHFRRWIECCSSDCRIEMGSPE